MADPVQPRRAKRLNGRNDRLSSHLGWADLRRRWDFISTGRRNVPWEDANMDRLIGAPQALEFVRANTFRPSDAAFDAAISSSS